MLIHAQRESVLNRRRVRAGIPLHELAAVRRIHESTASRHLRSGDPGRTAPLEMLIVRAELEPRDADTLAGRRRRLDLLQRELAAHLGWSYALLRSVEARPQRHPGAAAELDRELERLEAAAWRAQAGRSS